MIQNSSLQGNIDIIQPHSTIIIGFSGGPDSVYLTLFLKSLKSKLHLNLIVAHLDHQWRPESAQEAIWCQQFCKNSSLTFITKQASEIIISQKYNGSKEQYARQKRRAFFKEIAQKYNATHIALAQHKDDQIETFFIRLARGTSLTGLTGIKKIDGMYIRPLLNLSKQHILDYLNHKCIRYLIDPSNKDSTYLRNRIRNTVIPALHTTDHRYANNIIHAIDQLQKTNNFLDVTTQESLQKITTHKISDCIITKDFLQLHEIIQQRILLHLLIKINATFIPSQSLFKEIIRFLQSNKSIEHAVHPTYKIIKNKNLFSITKQ